jgi:hypothetical protein
MQIKERLKHLKKSQVWLIFKLRERGIEVSPPFLSSTISGLYTYPKAKAILVACDEILKEVEFEDVK